MALLFSTTNAECRFDPLQARERSNSHHRHAHRVVSPHAATLRGGFTSAIHETEEAESPDSPSIYLENLRSVLLRVAR
jgi:hypothetical protein